MSTNNPSGFSPLTPDDAATVCAIRLGLTRHVRAENERDALRGRQ